MTTRSFDDFRIDLARCLRRNRISRRQALWLIGVGTLCPSTISLQGCATSPVTGESILVGMTEAQERAIDAQVSPHQFSQDLGAVQDGRLNDYVTEVGRRVSRVSHRPDMPYSYRVLNANYVNAYTFPGGAMGVTRGIVSELDNEAQLAALLGHETGHVNARHAAQRQGQSLLAQVAVVGLNVAVRDSQWGALLGMGSQLGASALLASYSRDNEREADALGQDYLVRAGYPADAMVGLQQLLVDQEKQAPGLLETMFSSHPMSSERRDIARHRAETVYAATEGADPHRERFLDRTAGLRRLKPTIEACQNGELAMTKKQLPEAEKQFRTALTKTPRDYAATIRMAQCLQAQGKGQLALRYADAARKIYPEEAQGHKLAGILALSQREPAAAYQAFDDVDRTLPGDAGIAFLKGVAAEGTGDKRLAARHYAAYLNLGQRGQAAQYAYGRLQKWGLVK
ncbi:M48 family metalloprotease [Desulfofustis glycolicus]|uniref:Putative Zn-dependent protease, contains TPR repeats n=1 Tax=Desulfofustis glycolicus DSM 9705 TaxID=1121409 RepID=A0A1M5S1Y7_9BACT|nr:M48 family metalloprotease [Desulfofustis glycolicus]SHH32431.1 Putative Zn-dependent protease, contains TPR repeats [Desulfofustis glycolicus DSM 9705]